MATEIYQKPTQPPQTQVPKPQLMHVRRCANFVAGKTVREYNRNKEKKRKFCLEEKKQLQRETQQREARAIVEQNRPCEEMPGTSNTSDSQAIQYQAGPSSRKQKNSIAQKQRT